MEFKNVSGTTVHIGEHQMVAPGESVFLTDEQAKHPMVQKLVKGMGWLQPVFQEIESEAVGAFVQDEINNVTNNHPNITQNFDVNITIPVGSKEEATQKEMDTKAFEELRSKAVAEAAARAQKQKQWNPMDDAFPDNDDDEFIYVPPVVGKGQYGNIEHGHDEHPLVNAGADGSGKVDYIKHHVQDAIEAAEKANSQLEKEAGTPKTTSKQPKKTTKKKE